MDEYYRVVKALPLPLSAELAGLNPAIAPRIQEIRLRMHHPVLFTIGGRLCPARRYLPGVQCIEPISAETMQQCFLQLCRDSVYAYEDELHQGFLTISGGHRVGVAGNWGGNGLSMVTSLNLRVARWILCDLPEYVQAFLKRPQAGILVAGPPGCGKTTFLRTLIQYLGATDEIVCVVDERGELTAGDQEGFSRPDYLCCDVYTRCSKAEGIQMALRCMNPTWIICDELGTQEDVRAVEQGTVSGVRFLASMHCDGEESLAQNPRFQSLLHTQAFSRIALLTGKKVPGTICRWMELS